MHQPVYHDINCVIRRVCFNKVWYLHSYDVIYNVANWTTKYHKAHQFKNSQEASDFIRIFLRERAEECDTFSEHETWSI